MATVATSLAALLLLAGSANAMNEQCRELWNRKVQRWEQKRAARKEKVEFGKHWPDHKEVWFDNYEPEWDCDLEDRVGLQFGDGGKFVCGFPYVQKEKQCLVYSLGSNMDTRFEKDILDHTHCDVHTFDPTVDRDALLEKAKKDFGHNFDRFTFHLAGVSHKYKTFSKGFVAPLRDMRQAIQHEERPITILKADVEGSEFMSFKSIFQDCAEGRMQIDQLLIEMHLWDMTEGLKVQEEHIDEFFRGADACGLMIFHKERNGWGCKGHLCVEYSLISRRAAEKAFIESHCPYDD